MTAKIEYTYTYEEGKISRAAQCAITGTNLEIAYINPYRYRGYYFDREIEMYYLQSRYYDPVVGRFINADETVLVIVNNDMLTHNLFAYCHNNAVCNSDPSGYLTAEMTIALAFLFLEAAYVVMVAAFKIILGLIIVRIVVWAVVKLAKLLIKYAKSQKDKALAKSMATLAGFATAATPPPPNDPRFKGSKTNGSKKLYEKGKVRVEVENMGENLGSVHLQIKGDPNKYYYSVKDVKFYLDRSHTKLASQTIQNYLNDQKILNAIIKGLTKYLGY